MFLRRAAVALPYSSSRFLSAKCTHDVAISIAELNKEMESVFGEPASNGLLGSISNDHVTQEPQVTSDGLASSTTNKCLAQDSRLVYLKMNRNHLGLTHVDRTGEAQMVDVSAKEASKRTAIASCKVILGQKVFDMVLANQMAKGDVLTVAKIAGINGAKHTSSLIPLCHNITLTHVQVDLKLNSSNYSVEIEGEAASTGKTGVEMEALTAVTAAALTVYDMCKAASKEIRIADIQLECKTGGKSGDWNRCMPKPMDTSIEIEKVPKPGSLKIEKKPKIRRFIQFTLRHVEGVNLSNEMVIERVASCFNCRSIVVANERHADGGFSFHVGVLTVDATEHDAKKLLRSKFIEFENPRFFLKFHKGWGKICENVTNEDKSPSVWGEYTVEQILGLAEASRNHKKMQLTRSSSY